MTNLNKNDNYKFFITLTCWWKTTSQTSKSFIILTKLDQMININPSFDKPRQKDNWKSFICLTNLNKNKIKNPSLLWQTGQIRRYKLSSFVKMSRRNWQRIPLLQQNSIVTFLLSLSRRYWLSRWIDQALGVVSYATCPNSASFGSLCQG